MTMDKKEIFVVKADGFGYFNKLFSKTKIRWASKPNEAYRYASKVFAEKRAKKIGGYVVGYTINEWIETCKSNNK